MNTDDTLVYARAVLKNRLSQLLINEEMKAGAFRIPIHLALGHEAIAYAVDSIMGPDDSLILSHRNIHYNLARGGNLKKILDEFSLKKEGLCGGRAGSMNLSNANKGIPYTSSILGNNLCVAAGCALAKTITQPDGLAIVVTGDGAMEEGSLYETLVFLRSTNSAAIIIVENNGWSLATQIEERRCAIDLQGMADTFAIQFARLPGNDGMECARLLKEIREHSLAQHSPAIVEVNLTTLGDWRLKTDEYPDGKFINYHAGAAPTVEISDWPVISETTDDPIYTLTQKADIAVLKEIASEELRNLKDADQ